MINLNQQDNLSRLPCSVWPVESVAQLECDAANALGITLYELMKRAGEAAFSHLCLLWPQKQHWLILCGHGNNGGDGFVIARLAQARGLTVTVIADEGNKSLPQEAQQARNEWLAAGGVSQGLAMDWPDKVDVIVDALLGTGLKHAPEGAYQALIERANAHPAPVFAVDIPSGLMATEGTAPGKVIQADHTLTFIALKPGLLTGKARDYVGKLHYHGLNLQSWLASQNAPFARYDAACLVRWLQPRRPSCHKGNNGKLLIIGGDHGTGGAIRLVGEAALRAGAGLVRVLTQKDNIVPLLTARPELMVDELNKQTLEDALEWTDVVVIGPGLGQEDWGKNALKKVENSQKPMLWDADALNLLAINPDKRQNRIITPHPGEAARLLGVSTIEIESDRLLSAQRLAKQYGGVVVLKGAGTLIATDKGQLAFADVGNASMATGGMGDVLSGIIGGLLGQKLALYEAACAGCVVHGAAAEQVSKRTGQRGMIASDLFSELYLFVNPEMSDKK
ncbi:bifunctional ADP-dependent NAD(P)H-hydrate dehydratase/NAD(P)H-hydrate epimerase [Erwinia tracheiphila]|uniref:Bifunctional NAD(P)H-hydrate repair enzyme n=1 Tax=Erwinia tracheiphila TaxID=65700 RepID=A0A0M2KH42_9GAMM|nr:bifunctional ADP-dependent NAD(P)H-hydrate dehydratase/NAD(P)H-hydrate epimerase [Erwinia tracheiphila]EOS95122.1 carbohydrate kinase [Erwinia tracheiphila PSU-1]KKF36271.1 carbohydrate kinase [Erwinia tracheiphila]UIA87598.1 bifunctional ADP-dependent NAD(P)H-hydrate dehydratase/NAD(P)H-hydrate epimerase [Erwinia tracheiphila]UIA95962.1 bifunctional ADP-dependent NAD(P)H-hydrate dehydratase/NAD(P)H-hydrate epimerase [Erwinia tracheiphila]